MKIFKIPLISLISIFSLNVSTFGFVPGFISANSYGNIDIKNSSIISSTEKGEIISKLSDSSSLFRLSLSGENQYTTGQYAKIINENNSFVSVYSNSNTNSSILGQIDVNSTILINGTEGDFARILFNDNIGYIEKKYTKTTGIIEKNEIQKPNNNTKPTEIANEQQAKKTYAKITAETNLNFRNNPSTNAQILAKIPFNTYVEVLEIQNDWLKVLYNGQAGYISKQFANITNNLPNTQSNSSAKGAEIVEFAKKYLGKPYIYGSTNLERGTDCSGFTYSVFKNFGININRVSKDQFLNGTPVEKQNLMLGDLVFFNTGGNSPISHVGIYIGNSQYIHCTDSKNQGVIISSLNSDYGLKTYYGARRIIN